MGMEMVEAGKGGNLFFTKPIFALTLASVFLGEPFTVFLIIGVTCIITSILLVLKK